MYRQYLVELEQVISDSLLLGPVVVVGDFHAHLGSFGGSRGLGDINAQGVMLHELMIRCDLKCCFWGDYTYRRGECQTTVDYVLVDVRAAYTYDDLLCYTF